MRGGPLLLCVGRGLSVLGAYCVFDPLVELRLEAMQLLHVVRIHSRVDGFFHWSGG